MSSAPEGQGARRDQDDRLSVVEVLAADFVDFIDAFEGELAEGQVPPVFAERLAQLLQRAERLV